MTILYGLVVSNFLLFAAVLYASWAWWDNERKLKRLQTAFGNWVAAAQSLEKWRASSYETELNRLRESNRKLRASRALWQMPEKRWN